MYLNSPILVAAAKGQVELTEGMEGSSNDQMYSCGHRKPYILLTTFEPKKDQCFDNITDFRVKSNDQFWPFLNQVQLQSWQ